MCFICWVWLMCVDVECGSNIYYINDKLDKRTWTYIFGACCATTVFIPSFHNYRIWSFLGLGMTTYTAWYLTVAALAHGQVISNRMKALQHKTRVRTCMLWFISTSKFFSQLSLDIKVKSHSAKKKGTDSSFSSSY